MSLFLMNLKVKKRDGTIVPFDEEKIRTAVGKAYIEVCISGFGTHEQVQIDKVTNKVCEILRSNVNLTTVDIEQIQDTVEYELMRTNPVVAKAYITYRYRRGLARQFNTTDKNILELIAGKNDYWNEENSNKNARLVTTQRDYMSGIVSEDISRRILLPKDVVDAHDEGIIHFHDIDYFAQKTLHNCDLINLEDMLQNGTVISGVLIEKPHSFSTACNIAMQIVAQVASSQYGGQTISLTHLAPFVDVSRKAIRKEVEWEIKQCEGNPAAIDKIVEKRLMKEIEKGVQTIQYQVVTLQTTNGQAPFLSVFMYLNEAKDELLKNDLALVVEEVLKQRIQGVKNEQGVWVSPAFPKLLYTLEEDNVNEDGRYYYLSELAAKCAVKRLTPDDISEKKMLEYKIDTNGNGNVYPCMGCVDGDEIVTYRFQDKLYVESFRRMWQRMSDYFRVNAQFESSDDFLYLDTSGVEIYDTKNGFTNVKRIIRNMSNEWLNVKLSNGRSLVCTPDHPLPTKRGRIEAENLREGDIIEISPKQFSTEELDFDNDKAWLLGFLLCDGCYDNHLFSSIAIDSENDIEVAYKERMRKCFESEVDTIVRTRGKRGNYKDLVSRGNVTNIIDYLSAKFEGLTKTRRHIPNEVFSWNYNAKLNFLAGMIDADGYINPTTHGGAIVQIGSTNKELGLQQAALARSLGMPASVYQNHYSKTNPNAIRYRVEFAPSRELINYLVSQKKKEKYSQNDTDYYHLTAKVNSVEKITGKIDFSYDVTTESDFFEVSGIYSHNCRSFLTPYVDENGNPKYYGRFNQGVVTINLPDIALSSKGDIEKFWELFEERTELCHKALRCKHERLKGTISDVAPILWQHGALARLKKGEKIDKLLYSGYSTLSLGYAGLYECVKYMTGNSHTDGNKGEKFGLKVMQALNGKCEQWKTAENIAYSLYGSPIESTTYKFAKCLKKRFGEIKGITDRNYITNSYHIPVFEKINAFDKLAIEAKFQKLSPGGAISYVEVPDLTDNPEAVLQLYPYIYDNIMYAEQNTKSDYCFKCGYEKEIKIEIDKATGKLYWRCPNCGNTDPAMLYITRRTCGYIGTNLWNPGRTEEIAERVLHIDDIPFEEDSSE